MVLKQNLADGLNQFESIYLFKQIYKSQFHEFPAFPEFVSLSCRGVRWRWQVWQRNTSSLAMLLASPTTNNRSASSKGSLVAQQMKLVCRGCHDMSRFRYRPWSRRVDEVVNTNDMILTCEMLSPAILIHFVPTRLPLCFMPFRPVAGMAMAIDGVRRLSFPEHLRYSVALHCFAIRFAKQWTVD